MDGILQTTLSIRHNVLLDFLGHKKGVTNSVLQSPLQQPNMQLIPRMYSVAVAIQMERTYIWLQTTNSPKSRSRKVA